MSPEEYSSNLAYSILYKELELDSSPTAKVLHELVDLYSKAIEYHCQNDDLRHLDFEYRMHSTLRRPDVLRLLQAHNKSNEPFEKPPPPVSVIERKASHLIRQHSMRNSRSVNSIKSDLRDQDLRLSRKLTSRMLNSQRSTLDSCSDKEDSAKFDVEALIEDMVERNSLEEAEKVSSVKAKYSPVIAELEGQGTIEKKISLEVQEQMNREIEIIKQDFDIKRERDVSSLKELLNVY